MPFFFSQFLHVASSLSIKYFNVLNLEAYDAISGKNIWCFNSRIKIVVNSTKILFRSRVFYFYFYFFSFFDKLEWASTFLHFILVNEYFLNNQIYKLIYWVCLDLTFEEIESIRNKMWSLFTSNLRWDVIVAIFGWLHFNWDEMWLWLCLIDCISFEMRCD